jgi:hypothetical protein
MAIHDGVSYMFISCIALSVVGEKNMVLPYSGGARSPGPLGIGPYLVGGHLPGPLGFKQVNSPQTGLTKSSRSLPMPPPWTSSTDMRARVVDWKLSNGKLKPTDVIQGALPNCPIAAILAALAHTPAGQKYLDRLITEYKGAAVKTVLSADLIAKIMKADDSTDNLPQAPELVSNRFFKVALGKSPDVHDTFYVRYTETKDSALLDPVFMGSPNGVLWPAVIEKACALHFGSYIEIGNYKKHTANEFWEFVVGAKEQRLAIDDKTDIEKIRAVASNAGRVPAIGASRDDPPMPSLTGFHGFAVLGMQGEKIQLYDPAKAKEISLSLEEFRANFKMMLSGNPP